MNYRAAVQKLMEDIDQVYESAGTLRDAADNKEKQFWNMVRTETRKLYGAFNEFDNQLPDDRATMELGYEV